MSKELINAIADIQEEYSVKLSMDLLDSGVEPMEIIEFCREGMNIVGERFENNEYFMPELIMSGEILAQITEIIKPHLKKGDVPESKGKIVFGTVEGDIHDLAKDIVISMLEINGFEVIDLGIDVPPAVFVAKLKEVNASILGLSGFLHFASESMKKTIEALTQAGLREEVKVMVGGGQMNEFLKNYIGADAWGNNAMTAVNLAKDWTSIGGEQDDK